ncbi:MAG: universal stress protein [Gemmatimonadaceae bacterium]
MSEESTKSTGVPTFELHGRIVLLAMDDSAAAAAGARVALALAKTHGAVVHVLTVVDTGSLPFPPALNVALAIEDPERDLTSHQAEVQDAREALATAAGEVIDWPIRVAIGAPASTIVEEAQRIDAALVIVGLHRYARFDRAMNNEIALTVMRRSPCPVLGVVPAMMQLPVRILAATDFSAISRTAARAARAIAGDAAVLVLAYAAPITALLADEGERAVHDLGVRAAFAEATRELGDDGVTFDHVVLEHDISTTTAETILKYAESSQSDLIAAGSSRQGRIERWMMGSVSTELVRHGGISVLVVRPQRK